MKEENKVKSPVNARGYDNTYVQSIRQDLSPIGRLEHDDIYINLGRLAFENTEDQQNTHNLAIPNVHFNQKSPQLKDSLFHYISRNESHFRPHSAIINSVRPYSTIEATPKNHLTALESQYIPQNDSLQVSPYRLDNPGKVNKQHQLVQKELRNFNTSEIKRPYYKKKYGDERSFRKLGPNKDPIIVFKSNWFFIGLLLLLILLIVGLGIIQARDSLNQRYRTEKQSFQSPNEVGPLSYEPIQIKHPNQTQSVNQTHPINKTQPLKQTEINSKNETFQSEQNQTTIPISPSTKPSKDNETLIMPIQPTKNKVQKQESTDGNHIYPTQTVETKTTQIPFKSQLQKYFSTKTVKQNIKLIQNEIRAVEDVGKKIINETKIGESVDQDTNQTKFSIIEPTLLPISVQSSNKSVSVINQTKKTEPYQEEPIGTETTGQQSISPTFLPLVVVENKPAQFEYIDGGIPAGIEPFTIQPVVLVKQNFSVPTAQTEIENISRTYPSVSPSIQASSYIDVQYNKTSLDVMGMSTKSVQNIFQASQQYIQEIESLVKSPIESIPTTKPDSTFQLQPIAAGPNLLPAIDKTKTIYSVPVSVKQLSEITATKLAQIQSSAGKSSIEFIQPITQSILQPITYPSIQPVPAVQPVSLVQSEIMPTTIKPTFQTKSQYLTPTIESTLETSPETITPQIILQPSFIQPQKISTIIPMTMTSSNNLLESIQPETVVNTIQPQSTTIEWMEADQFYPPALTQLQVLGEIAPIQAQSKEFIQAEQISKSQVIPVSFIYAQPMIPAENIDSSTPKITNKKDLQSQPINNQVQVPPKSSLPTKNTSPLQDQQNYLFPSTLPQNQPKSAEQTSPSQVILERNQTGLPYSFPQNVNFKSRKITTQTQQQKKSPQTPSNQKQTLFEILSNGQISILQKGTDWAEISPHLEYYRKYGLPKVYPPNFKKTHNLNQRHYLRKNI